MVAKVSPSRREVQVGTQEAPKYPAALWMVCAVELCERFAGHLLGALLVLYLNERLGLAEGGATRLRGYFNGLVYGGSVLGGVLADRVLGTRRAVFVGASLLAFGYGLLSLDQPDMLYPALGLLIAGQALFKPNITALVGKLFSQGDTRRDGAYGLFYVAINIGAATAPVAGGMLRAAYGWSAAFSAAGGAMVLALAIAVFGYRWLGGTARHTDIPIPILPTTACHAPLLLGVLASVLLFSVALTQPGGALLFWVRDCMRRDFFGYEVPPSYFIAMPAVVLLALSPVLAALFRVLRRRGIEPSAPSKIGIGLLCSVLAYGLMTGAALMRGNAGQTSALWLLGCMVLLTLGEVLVMPISLSLVTQFVPSGAAAMAIGLWFAATAIGEWLAGELGALWSIWPHSEYFALITLLSLAALGMPKRMTSPHHPNSPL